MVSLSRVHLTALIVASMLFMEQLDGTILSTALPSIANSLHVDTVATSVALTAYIIGLAIFIPASGALADRLGSRTVLSGAIIMFVLCSVACASAHSLTFLACMRTLQGIGGALMVPVGRLVVL
ncbi:MAG: MFS transporter, partial [Acetobacter cibinongensis]